MIMAELALLTENKKELVDHLNDLLIDPLLQELQCIYDETRKTLSIHESNSKLLKIFQDKLTHIPEWSKEDKQKLYEKILKSTGITYLNELIQGILGTQIKIIIKTENPNLEIPKIKFRVPSTENFLHICLIITARTIWKQTYLMYHNVRNLEKQHNIAQLEEIIRKSISSAIRSCLPLDHLFKYIQENTSQNYQTEIENDNEEVEDEEDAEDEEDEEDAEDEETEDEEDEEEEDEEVEDAENEEDAEDEEENEIVEDDDEEENEIVEDDDEEDEEDEEDEIVDEEINEEDDNETKDDEDIDEESDDEKENTENKVNIEPITEEIEDIKENIENIKEEIEDIKENLEDVIEDIKENLEDIQQENNVVIENIKEDIEITTNKEEVEIIEDIKENIEIIKDDIKEIEEKLEDVKEEIQQENESIEIIKNEIEPVESKPLSINKTQSIEELEKELEKELDTMNDKNHKTPENNENTEIKIKPKQLPLRIVPLNIRNEIIRQKKLNEKNIIPKKTDAFF